MAAFIHTAPARLRLAVLWRRIHTASVPVLMFHGVLPDAGSSPFNASGKFVSPEKMRTFLERLSRIFRVVEMKEFVESAIRGRRLSNAMVLTFDDGYENVYRHAYPVLAGMGMPFTVFVSTGFVDTGAVLAWDALNYAVRTTAAETLPAGILPRDADLRTSEARADAARLLKAALKTETADRVAAIAGRICETLGVPRDGPQWNPVRFLSSGQIREMAERGVEFGGHTISHPILSRESPERVRAEVRGCKSALEAMTGRPVAVFAYPNGGRGDFDEATKRELREAGYAASFSTIHGLHRPGDDLFEIRRVGVNDRWTYEELETRASGVLKALGR